LTLLAPPVFLWFHIPADRAGPLLPLAGSAAPLSTTSAAFAFIAGWVSRFGIPASTSDRSPQFASSLWSSVCSQLGISHTLIPAYHPQANGVVERFHRCLKDGLRAREAGPDWYLHLPWVLLGIRTATANASLPSPAESLYSSQLVLPGQLVAAEDPPVASQFLDTQEDG
jgi:transposase InsO family protein